jgi:hypothetical protein
MDYVLVHGTTQSPAGWQRLAGALTRRGNRVQAVDLPTSQPELLAADYAGRSLTEPPTADPVVAAYFLFHDCDLATLRWAVPTLRLFFPAAAYQQAPLLAGPWRPQRMCCRRPTVRSGRSGCAWPYVNAWDVNRWRSTAATAPTFRSPKPSLKS